MAVRKSFPLSDFLTKNSRQGCKPDAEDDTAGACQVVSNVKFVHVNGRGRVLAGVGVGPDRRGGSAGSIGGVNRLGDIDWPPGHTP